MLYTQQRMFDNGNTAGKHLAWVLVDNVVMKSVPLLKTPGGSLTKDVNEKLNVFSDFYQELYSTRPRRAICGMISLRLLISQ